MKLLNSEIENEKKYLDTVEGIIHSEIDEMQADVNKKMEEVNVAKREIYAAKTEEYLDGQDAIRSVYDVESKVDYVNKKIDKIELYKRAASIPYFGKITCDFKDDKENVYIGITSVEKDNNFYVYDWRSPIASLFYNYELGDASYKIDTKEIKCNIERKIQFKIKDGKLIRCFDSSINIDDEYLQEILSNTNDKKLTNIISTIQKEQNQIIRNEDDKNLLVQGTAGSGKTVVALHRIAYLLYRNAKLESKNILIISPNEIFSDYISDVLPELGEKNTKCFTLTSYLESYLNSYKIESYIKFISRVEEGNKDITKKMKASKDLRKFVKNYYSEFNFTRKFTIGDVTFYAKDINYMFNEKYKRLCIKDRFRRISEYVCNQVGIRNKAYYNKIKSYLISNSNISLDIYEVYSNFLKSKKLTTFLNNNVIKYEDVINILNISFYVNGVKKDLSLKHVVIDEAQDYTVNEIEIIKKMFPEAAFTILGDDNQNINICDKSKIIDYASLFKTYRYIELNKTYRSTENIVDYSNKILGLNNVCAVRNTVGEEVEVKKLSINNLKKCINDSKGKYKKIAIITDNMDKAKKLYKELNDKDIQLINFDTDTFDKDIFVMPSYLSKGLEFEYAIVYKEDEYTNKNLYYVSVTRAQHKLTILE